MVGTDVPIEPQSGSDPGDGEVGTQMYTDGVAQLVKELHNRVKQLERQAQPPQDSPRADPDTLKPIVAKDIELPEKYAGNVATVAVWYQCFDHNVSDDTWSRARDSAGDNYECHQE